MTKTLKIGCCGFPVSRKKYMKKFNVIELQNTFYNLPSTEWAIKLRKEAPENFEFIVKAWQVITHPSKSPTWRRLKEKPSGKLENYGWLKPTYENFEALDKVINIADKLNAKIIIFQTPASMPYNTESIEWVKKFFEEITEKYNDILFGWEPRGEWNNNPRILKSILCNYGIIHVVDLFKRKPTCIPNGILYVRLHGLNGEINYKYKYTINDLEKLLTLINELEFNTGYIMFNNVYMYQDAKLLKQLAVEHGFEVI